MIDSTPPEIISASVDNNPMTMNQDKLNFSAKVSEPATVMLKLVNRETSKNLGYLTMAEKNEATYTWDFSEGSYSKIDDGFYDLIYPYTA